MDDRANKAVTLLSLSLIKRIERVSVMGHSVHGKERETALTESGKKERKGGQQRFSKQPEWLIDTN